MELLFLGTSAGMPSKRRNVTGLAVIEDQGKGWYLVDCGEATQHQLLQTPLSMHGLKGIFITHTHGDHCYGLPGLLASAAMQGRKQPLTIVAPPGVHEWLEATRTMVELYTPYGLEYVVTETMGERIIDDMHVTAHALEHRVPSWAYRFSQHAPKSLDKNKLEADGIPRGPIWGLLQQGQDSELNGRSICADDYRIERHRPTVIVVGGDNARPDLLKDACTDACLLVHEATYTVEVSAKVGEQYGHSDADRVAWFAEQNRIPNLILTHFSARYQPAGQRSPSMDDLRNEAAAVYNGRLYLAEDFDRYRVSAEGVVEKVVE